MSTTKHLTNHRLRQTRNIRLGKQERTHKTMFIYGHINEGRLAEKLQHCVDTGCRLKDLQRTISMESVLSAHLDDDDFLTGMTD